MHFNFSSIDNIVEKHSDLLVNAAKEQHWIITNLHKKAYYTLFEQLINENDVHWIGNPDTFKIAACLIAAIIEEKPLKFDVNENIPSDIVLYNYRLAVNVALDFLSTTEIHTYTANSEGNFVVEQNHPTVKMAFPTGIIEAEEMYLSFCKSLAVRNLREYSTSLTSIAIILHLLYCYCLAEGKKVNAEQ